MTEGNGPSEEKVYAFILENIESVPHLEALLLVWEARPKIWSASDLAGRLYVSADTARRLLQDLHRQALITPVSDRVEQYFYKSETEADTMMSALAETYRREMVRVSTFIHSKGSPAVRDFARAFRFKKGHK